MSGGSGGSSAPSKQEIRYAPYLERSHKALLDSDGSVSPSLTVIRAFNNALDQSPYSSYTSKNTSVGFFGYKEDGETLWELGNFPSLYDMFGKFMAGLDVCTLWNQVYESITNGPEINNSISEHYTHLKDEVDQKAMPSFLAGMRDINGIQSSSFIVGKALLYDTVTKETNRFASQVRLKALDATSQVWAKHLDWNTKVVSLYADILKQYYSVTLAVDKQNMEFQAKDTTWNLNLFDYTRAMLGALNGAAAATGGGNAPSQTQQAIGGALSGAAMGGMIGSGPMGAAIGGALGLAASFF